jgi:hypothetical protein
MMPTVPSMQPEASRTMPDRIILVGILGMAALTRIIYLGDRSLWLDELSTWHVSRLSLIESLTWPAELSPPLYALCVRALGGGTHPPEWLLRYPAAVAGVLTVAAVWRLARQCGGGLAATAGGMLAAVHVMLIDYSREARPYSLLSLFVTLAMSAALRVARERTGRAAWEWTAWATLALYSHPLAAFSLVACIAFWVWSARRAAERSLVRSAALAVLVTGLFAIPLVLRSWHYRAETAAGLSWIDRPTGHSTLLALAAVAPGGSARAEDFRSGMIGLGLVLIGSIGGLAAWRAMPRGARTTTVNVDSIVLLSLWLVGALGLPFLFSIAGLPMLVPRFVLPAAIPLLLLPLIVLTRVSPRAVTGLAVVLLVLEALGARRVMDAAPAGLRELVGFLDESVRNESGRAVLCIHARSETFAEYERLGLRYYRPESGPVGELWLSGPDDVNAAVLRDPRRLYLIVFQGDPAAMLRAAGRKIEPFGDLPDLEKPVDALLFEPYRLMQVAPLPPTGL